VFVPGHTVAMVSYCATMMIAGFPAIVGQLFGTGIVASTEKEWLY